MSFENPREEEDECIVGHFYDGVADCSWLEKLARDLHEKKEDAEKEK